MKRLLNGFRYGILVYLESTHDPDVNIALPRKVFSCFIHIPHSRAVSNRTLFSRMDSHCTLNLYKGLQPQQSDQ